MSAPIDSDRLKRVEALYHDALERPVEERAAFLIFACGADDGLRREVASLLAYAGDEDGLLAPLLDATAAAFSARVAAGDALGPYTIVESIGAGGMGEVYRAHDARLQRDVAIKMLLPAETDPDREQRLLGEARAAGALNHPNILTVYDVGMHDGSPFVVSELLVGRTLRQVLDDGPMPVVTAIDAAIQVARGCAAAHDQGIVHRDLKPENLFVTADGRVKILDFGLARRTGMPQPQDDDDAGKGSRMTGEGGSGTQAGTVMGSPGYMAPEQVRGEAVDGRSDIFALGAILDEMLTGQRAFGRASKREEMDAVLHDEPAPLPASIGSLAPRLDEVVRRAVRKAPADRFPSAHALVEALASVREAGQAEESASAARSWWPFATMAATIIAALAGTFLLFDRGRAATADAEPVIRALAVLPLTRESANVEDYFTDGITDTLIANLSQLDSVRVISRTSSMRYKGQPRVLPDIVRALQVDAIVEGSVARSGDRVRISAQLVDATTDRVRWSQSYERDMRDVLSLEGEVARAIAEAIRVTLTPQQRAHLTQPAPVAPEAQEAYLRGRYFLAKGAEDNITRAIADFTTATTAAPQYAAPYAGLSDAYTALRSVYRSPHDVMPMAKAAAERALALDPLSAEAHVSMGGVLMYYEFDWIGAQREFLRAIELSPNLASAHDMYALYLAALGRRDEARREASRARELDPLSVVIMVDTGFVHYLAREYDAMIAVNQKALDLDDAFWPAHRDLGWGLQKVGRMPDAIASMQRARQIDDNSTIFEMLGNAYATWGKTSDARRVLSELSAKAREGYVCPYEIAMVHHGLGDMPSTLAQLERGYGDRADCMPWMYADPEFESLHADPRFQSLLKRMGFPDAAGVK
ncbi:MAG: protein kinase [Acidobacteriota bacterium]